MFTIHRLKPGDVALMHGMLKTFGLLPGAGRGLRFDRRVEELIEAAPDGALIIRPLLASWRQLREQVVVFDRRCSVRSGRTRSAAFS